MFLLFSGSVSGRKNYSVSSSSPCGAMCLSEGSKKDVDLRESYFAMVGSAYSSQLAMVAVSMGMSQCLAVAEATCIVHTPTQNNVRRLRSRIRGEWSVLALNYKMRFIQCTRRYRDLENRVV